MAVDRTTQDQKESKPRNTPKPSKATRATKPVKRPIKAAHTDRPILPKRRRTAGAHMLLSRALLEYRRANRNVLAPLTLRNRTYTIENLLFYVGRQTHLQTLSRTDIADWLANMEVSASTLRVRLSDVRAFVHWCQDYGLLHHDPTSRIRLPRLPRQVPRALKDDQIEALWNVLPDARARAIIALMAGMGLRAGEVAGLQMSDLDFLDDVLRVVGKGGHERTLPIPAAVRTHLEGWLAERGRKAGAVFVGYTTGRGIGAHYVSQLVSGWVKAAGLKQAPWDGRSAHALRHSTAERLYQAGTELRVIQSVLGHQNAVTTWKYLRSQADLGAMRSALAHEASALRDDPAPPPPDVSVGASLTCRRPRP